MPYCSISCADCPAGFVGTLPNSPCRLTHFLGSVSPSGRLPPSFPGLWVPFSVLFQIINSSSFKVVLKSLKLYGQCPSLHPHHKNFIATMALADFLFSLAISTPWVRPTCVFSLVIKIRISRVSHKSLNNSPRKYGAGYVPFMTIVP